MFTTDAADSTASETPYVPTPLDCMQRLAMLASFAKHEKLRSEKLDRYVRHLEAAFDTLPVDLRAELRIDVAESHAEQVIREAKHAAEAAERDRQKAEGRAWRDARLPGDIAAWQAWLD